MNQRELFLKHIAQTSPAPLGLEIIKAEGCLLFDSNGKEYLDLIGGISVANTGHRHPKVIAAIKEQLDAYLHIMVYGEYIQTPQVRYAERLTSHLPASLNSVYFTNSGAEAVEGAMKLAKRVTNRSRVIAFNDSYHGSTQGALSIIGSEYWRNAFRPLLPDVLHLDYGSDQVFDFITESTACVIVEPVQAEAGVRVPPAGWLQAISNKCSATGTLLILDEIQTGFGRTGKLWAFEDANIVPDILLLGKALGGGMPLGAFIADQQLMAAFTDNPVLGHISTFGGHPVSCAAGLAAFEVLIEEQLLFSIHEKEKLVHSLLNNGNDSGSLALIKTIRSAGLWFAVEFDSFATNKKVIDYCIQGKSDSQGNTGIITDWFLFAANCLRISPPLTITHDQLTGACAGILKACAESSA